MSIKNFILEFQDYLFIKKSYLHSLNDYNLSSSSIECSLKHTEKIIEDFKESLEFMDKESLEIHTEIEDIISSLNSKIDKINFYADAVKTINTTNDDISNIIDLHPYVLNTNNKNWEQNSKCYILEPKTNYTVYEPYSMNSDNFSNKGINKYTIDDTYSTRYININKHDLLTINNIKCFNSVRESLGTISLNSTYDTVIKIPDNTMYINIEYESTDVNNNNFTITPLSFYHFNNSIISLPFHNYNCGSSLSFDVKKDIPFGCYLQIKMYCVFKDINGNVVSSEEFWYSIDNDGRIVLKKEWVKDEIIERVWKNGAFKDIDKLDTLNNDDYVICKPTFDKTVTVITESNFKINNKNIKTVDIQPTLYMFSLSNETLTPRFFSMIGIMKK